MNKIVYIDKYPYLNLLLSHLGGLKLILEFLFFYG